MAFFDWALRVESLIAASYLLQQGEVINPEQRAKFIALLQRADNKTLNELPSSRQLIELAIAAKLAQELIFTLFTTVTTTVPAPSTTALPSVSSINNRLVLSLSYKDRHFFNEKQQKVHFDHCPSDVGVPRMSDMGLKTVPDVIIINATYSFYAIRIAFSIRWWYLIHDQGRYLGTFNNKFFTIHHVVKVSTSKNLNKEKFVRYFDDGESDNGSDNGSGNKNRSGKLPFTFIHDSTSYTLIDGNRGYQCIFDDAGVAVLFGRHPSLTKCVAPHTIKNDLIVLNEEVYTHIAANVWQSVPPTAEREFWSMRKDGPVRLSCTAAEVWVRTGPHKYCYSNRVTVSEPLSEADTIQILPGHTCFKKVYVTMDAALATFCSREHPKLTYLYQMQQTQLFGSLTARGFHCLAILLPGVNGVNTVCAATATDLQGLDSYIA